MAVDSGMIDEDHRRLIDIINEFIDIRPSPTLAAQLTDVLGKLDHYTRTHFAREQGLQKSIRYLYAGAHEREHVDLMRQLTEKRQKLAGASADLKSLHAEITQFLHGWLIDHIIQSDLRMRPFAAAIRQHGAGLVELEEAARGQADRKRG
jgi:hemerythrin